MFAAYTNASRAYANVGLETSVEAADPHKLVLMLYDGALAAMKEAHRQIESGDVRGKGKSLSKAIEIIESGLYSSLDMNAGGNLARQLADLYQYMSRRLLQANLENRIEMVDEVYGLLGELRGAWAEIRTQVVAPRPAVAAAGPYAGRPQLASMSFAV